MPAASPALHEAIAEGIAFEPFMHFQFQSSEPLHMEIASHRRAPLYVVGSGSGWLRWEDQAPVALHPGDVAFLPRAGRHRVYSDERVPRRSFEDLMAHQPRRHGRTFGLQVGAQQMPPQFQCSGSFYWRADLAAHPTVAALPPVLLLRQADAAAWLPSMAQLVAWMADIQRGGKGVGLTQTMNALLQHLVLTWLRSPAQALPHPPAGGAPHSPHDARLLAALHAIHTRPAEAWTAPALAALCHMSRTAFTLRFQAQMRQSPMRYLARWRIHLAARMLKEQRVTLQQAADAVGYSTGAILARAYKRERGVAPTIDGHPAEAGTHPAG